MQKGKCYRYDSTTGTFTVPPGGDGLYYFSAYFVVFYHEYAGFNIQINGEVLCTARTDEEQQTTTDPGQSACSAASSVAEGLWQNILEYYFRLTFH